MVLYNAPMPKFEKNQAGQVHVSITVVNYADRVLAEHNFMPFETIRTLTLGNALVDTGATLLGLPKRIIEQLGIPVDREITVNTATGECKRRVFRDANLTVNGRQGTFDCIELESIDQPLLGVVPMRMLRLQPDLQNQRLIAIPENEDETYIYA